MDGLDRRIWHGANDSKFDVFCLHVTRIVLCILITVAFLALSIGFAFGLVYLVMSSPFVIPFIFVAALLGCIARGLYVYCWRK
jgi:hypothetical protein